MTGRTLQKKVLRTIREHALFATADTVVAAVSGGADSVALLDILSALKELRLRLVVAHLNHMLRGAESDADEAFVRALAERYGVPCVAKRVDVGELSRQRKLSLEEAGRLARYAFFDEVAAEFGADSIALAHHADDQAETLLMRLLRGAGTTGLAGMAPRRAGSYVRPLLGVYRREIEEYLRERGLPWRTDSSNEDASFLRNRIRQELVPLLATYNPAIAERLASTAAILAADEEILEGMVAGVYGRVAREGEVGIVLDVRSLKGEPKGMRLRLYRRALSSLKGDLARITSGHLEGIDTLLSSERPNLALSLPGGVAVSRSYGSLSFALKAEEPMAPFELLIEGPGSYPLPFGATLSLEMASPPVEWESLPPGTAFIDPGKAPFPWLVRNFRAGDRFAPLGMGGRKKLKDFFIDEKIPPERRRRIPLLFCGGDLLWVCGLRRGEGACVTREVSEAVKVELL